MNRSHQSPAFRHLLTAVAAVLLTAQYPIPSSLAQNAPDSGGAVTVPSKQKVSIIIDRERSPQQTLLLVKILVPSDGKVESFTLSDPPRIVVDFVGVKIKTSENLVPPKNGVIKLIRLGAHADKLRIVMDLATTTAPQYEWRGGTRQATLRIVESQSNAPAPALPAQPTTPPQAQAPAVPPTAPTLPPTAPTAVRPTLTPTTTPTLTPTVTPTFTPTKLPALPPTNTPAAAVIENTAAKTEPQPKLPDMTDKDLEEALDKEVARASAALERGETLPDNTEFEGEDLVDVPDVEVEEADLSEEKGPDTKANTTTAAKAAGLVAKDLPTGTTTQGAAKTDTLTGLRSNQIPAPPTTDFTVESAEFTFLEPDHKEAFRIMLSRSGAQAQMSKVDPTTYKIRIPKCGLANLGLALPQYPPAEFKGLLAVSPKVESDMVEITVQVEPGVSLATLVRDRELWIKRQ